MKMKIKHNLDTSVLRPLLTSPKKVKDYYAEELKNEKYVSDYVRMEFLRGYIKSCINFYFLLAMPQYNSFSEVLNIWSNKFAQREHKNIEIMVSNLLDANHCEADKDKMLKYLADYIRRLIGKSFYKFKGIGNDNTYCIKGKTKLAYDPNNINVSFKNYLELLANNQEYKKCKINFFLKNLHKASMDLLIENKTLSLESDRDGFDKIIIRLEGISQKDITCAYHVLDDKLKVWVQSGIVSGIIRFFCSLTALVLLIYLTRKSRDIRI